MHISIIQLRIKLKGLTIVTEKFSLEIAEATINYILRHQTAITSSE